MRKVLIVLVGALGVAGLVAVAFAHMGDSGYAGPQGYGSGYGWMGQGSMHSGMGSGWMGQGMMGPGAMRGWASSGMGPGAMHSGMGSGWNGGMGPGAMHSGAGGGWMSRMGNWMGNMFGTCRTSHSGFDRGRPAGTSPAAPDTTTR